MTADPYTRIQNTTAELKRLEMEIEAQTGRMMPYSYQDSDQFAPPTYEPVPSEKRKRRHPFIFYTALILLVCTGLLILFTLALPALLLGAFAIRSMALSIAAIAVPLLLVVVLLLSR